MAHKYVIGLDYGTLSGRAVLVRTQDGEIIAQAVYDYPHGVMQRSLPCGTPLPPDWALQHPQDYLDVLANTVPAVAAQVDKRDIIGLSIDFTACTMLPTTAEGTPLCCLPQFAGRPHAFAKLWKHHGAQSQAEQIDALLKQRGELDLPRYGGKVSSELLLPKILQILQEDAEVYHAAGKLLEAVDWLSFLLTGEDRRTGSMAGYKAMWHHEQGYPPPDMLAALDPALKTLVDDKLSCDICPVGGRFGTLRAQWAEKLGLAAGIAVGAGIIDAHSGLPGCGITRPGQMMLILGTSSVQLALSEQPYSANGVLGGVKGGVMPGYYGVESGLASVGDVLGWFVNNCAGAACKQAADAAGLGLHEYLTQGAARLAPAESGLLALDWWNGNKTPFVDADLSGALIGCTLTTTPPEIYRALIESTAFGTRVIMEEFEKGGVAIDEVYACGGIVHKNPLLMQIYADVLGREIRVSASQQTAALGAAMYAAVAAGAQAGGYDDIFTAARAMGHVLPGTFRPSPAAQAVYTELYAEYTRLMQALGAAGSPLRRLRRLRNTARATQA